jgi:hypothetical protein
LNAEDNLLTEIGGIGAGSGGADDPTELQIAQQDKGKSSIAPNEGGASSPGKPHDEVEEVEETGLESSSTGAEALLWIKEGPNRGRIYPVHSEAVIGRKDGDLILDDVKVSNPHAKIICEDGQFVIWDFASKNGTFVDGERIRAATPLNENTLVKIGDSIFVFKVLD